MNSIDTQFATRRNVALQPGTLQAALLDRLTRTLGKNPDSATARDIYDALSLAVREELTLRWLATQRRPWRSLALVPVEDPSAYGLVRLQPDNSVLEFLEKPSPDQIDTNLISAGAYVLEREILELVPPDRNVSIEREVWPRLIDHGLYGFPSESYWLDIGTPERYLQGTFDIIEGNVDTAVRARLGDSWLAVAQDTEVHGRVIPPAVIERGVHIAPGAHVGSLVVLGENVRVGPGSTVERSVILSGAEIGANCTLRDCIIAAGCRVGDGSRIEGGAVLGEGVTVGADNTIAYGARIFPGVTLPDGALRF